MTFHKNINSIKMKTVGAVVFIHLLLLIAGVEPNPGPPDKQVLVFRYQYLLIEVGAELLRKLYDDKKSSYKDFNKDLTGLLATNILNNDQKNLLPPLDKNPNTANYDITLLTCLLRSTCGLKHPKDPVWKTPGNTDFTVEADITRLRECRNHVYHKGTVHMSESDFNQKWPELCQILRRLNNVCCVPNLSKMIDDASSNPLDDQLKQHYDNILKAWYESDSLMLKGIDDLKTGQSELKESQSELKEGQSELKDGQSELKDGQSELKDGQSELKDGQSEIKRAVCDGQSQLKDGQSEIIGAVCDGQSQLKDGQSEIIGAVCDLKEQTKIRLDHVEQALDLNLASNYYTNDDIKVRLRKSYEKHFKEVCVSPLYSKDDYTDMLTVYSRSKMEHVPYHRNRQSEGNYEISSYEQVFSKENTEFRNIFITGDAGMGKTFFGQFMSLLWSKAIAGDIVGDTKTQEDARFMTKFDFVFYISLKETRRVDVVRMIGDKYFITSSNDKYEETIKTIEQLLQTKNCLVILDGLDEWRPDTDNSGQNDILLPRRDTSDCDRCTYLTTCRPHMIETVRLSKEDIDHQVQITGFNYKKYIRAVISYINESENSNKDPEDFMTQIRERNMDDQLRIPLLTSQLIFVWKNKKNGISNMNRAMIYSSIVDMLFKRANKNKIEFPSMTSSDVHLPKPFSIFKRLCEHVCTLEKVCLLSFQLLFDPDNKTPSLVFTNDQLSDSYNISPDEIDLLCQLGIISKNKVIASFAEEKHKLSFLHTSYLEFLAALFVSLFAKTDFFRESVKKICINNVSKYEHFLILLSGISFHMTRIFFEIIYEKDEWDLFRRNCFFAFVINGNFQSPYDMQNITLSCLKEICVSDNSQRFIKLEDFRFEYLFEHQQNLKKLLNKNKHNVKSLKTACYRKEFNEVKCLQYLIIDMKFDVRFNKFMLQNQSTLHSLILHKCNLSSAIPVRSLPCLTSIRFERLTIKHDIYHDLMHYISGNILLENIVLRDVKCKEHDLWLSECCQFSLNLSKHYKLRLIDIDYTNIECSEIKNSCLLSLRLKGRSYSDRCPRITNVGNIIQNSKLEYLNLDVRCIHDTEINHVIDLISTLKYIKSVELFGFTIPNSVPLQIHPDIVCDEYIYIKLNHVTMSDKSFQDFIDCVVNHQYVVRVCIEDFDASPSNFNSWNDRCQKLEANKFVRMLYKCDDEDFIYDIEYDDSSDFCVYFVSKVKFEIETLK